MRGFSTAFAACMLVALTTLGASGLHAQNGAVAGGAGGEAFRPDSVAAAFLVHFIRFAEWPSAGTADEPYVIAVAGNPKLEEALLKIAARQKVRDRALRVVRLRGPLDLKDAHLVYFEDEGGGRAEAIFSVDEILAHLAGRPVLTVSNTRDFLARGGMIALYRDGENLRFEIAPGKVRESGLELSSRLLALSRPRPGHATAP